jgi:hypothetical protein
MPGIFRFQRPLIPHKPGERRLHNEIRMGPLRANFYLRWNGSVCGPLDILRPRIWIHGFHRWNHRIPPWVDARDLDPIVWWETEMKSPDSYLRLD